MGTYYFIFVILVCAVLVGFGSKRSLLNRSLYIFATILMIACAGLRDESVGRDYVMYREYFLASPERIGSAFFGQWSSTMPNVEVGYVYLNSLAKSIGLSFEVLIFLIAMIVVALYAGLFWKCSQFSAIALMMYYVHDFFHHEMIAIRGGLASALCLLIFWLWTHHRRCAALAFVAAAISVHLEAALVIIPLVLEQLKIEVRARAVLMTMGAAIIAGSRLDSSYSLFALVDRVALYRGSDQDVAFGIFTNAITVKQVVILGISCALLEYTRRKGELLHPFIRLCVISYWISTLWIVSFNQFGIIAARGASTLGIGEPLIVAQIVAMCYRESVLRRYRQIASCLVVGYALSMLIINLEVKALVDEYRSTFSYLCRAEPAWVQLANFRNDACGASNEESAT